MDIKNKTITIIGAARSGLAAANLVFQLGAKAKISESKKTLEAGQDLEPSIEIETAGHTKEFIQASHYVVLSPGVSIHSAPVYWAKEKGIEVMGEVELAYRLCPCPIVAITGSNGKTTTSTLIAEILKQAGRSVVLCGNIGNPFCSVVLKLKKSDIVVLEISSFQLESTVHFKPHVALWLNFSQNHLDRHKDLQEYFQAKEKIFANQSKDDFAVLDFNQKEFHDLVPKLKSRILFFNDSHPLGITNPNYLAAMTAAGALGVSQEISLKVFQEFKGVEHRLEFIRTLQGVDYINDSKSTTAQAGRWALERASKPLIMICGGSDKHIDYTSLRPLVAQKVKHMVVIGQIKEQIKNTFEDVISLETSDSLQGALEAAQKKAVAGDCVMLCPMTASFDMFNDYEHRGKVFKEIVHRLT